MAFFQLKSRAGKIEKEMLDASAFEQGDAPVNLAYPSDLFSDNASYGNAYTAFFISVHADEELAKVKDLTVNTYYTKDRKSGAMAQLSQEYGAGKVTAAISASVGTTSGYAAYKASSKGKLWNLSVGGLTGALTGGAIAIGGNNTGYKQQKACIILPTPNLDANYNFSWDASSNAILGGIADGAGGVIEGLGEVINNFSWNTIRNKFSEGIDAATALTNAITYKTPGIGDTVSRLNGYSPNPRKEQIFREPSFRHFTFNYTFAPRSQEEARNVEAIIRQFKYHAHPSLGAGDFCYRYPSEFDIVHYHNNEENLHLPKHTTSVLESVGVNYSPSDNYSFFSDGMPSLIQLSLRFVELGIITKEDIRKGY